MPDGTQRFAVTATRKQPTSVVLWSGYSRLDGAPIVVIATGLKSRSGNDKTGDMVQTWILRADMSPVEALNTGADESICGNCPARGNNGNGRKNKPKETHPSVGRFCYVVVHNAPRSVYASWRRGNIPLATEKDRAVIRSRSLRIGSYGDPAACPPDVWSDVKGNNWTGYSHQWKRFPDVRNYLMASCDNVAEKHQARALGCRTFRVSGDDDGALRPDEITCPSTTIGLSCVRCGLCKGAGSGAKSITIPAHGASKRTAGLTVLQ